MRRPRLSLGLHLEQDVSARKRSGGASAAAAAGRHDAAPGWLNPPLASGGRRGRPHRQPGRCPGDALLGLPGRAPCRASRGLPRCSPPTACRAASIPTASATTSTPPRRAAGWTRASPPKWDGCWPCSASSTSRPTRRRPAGAPSAPSSPSQERLPKELALRDITTRAAANRFLAETFIPNYYACFAAAPEQPGSAFVAVAPEQWRNVLCPQEERTVGNDNTVPFNSLVPQIPPRPHYVRGQGPRPALPGRQPGRPPRSALPRPIPGPTEPRSKTPHARGPRDTARRVPPVDLWTTLRLVHNSANATSPTEPSADVLHKPVNLIR